MVELATLAAISASRVIKHKFDEPRKVKQWHLVKEKPKVLEVPGGFCNILPLRV